VQQFINTAGFGATKVTIENLYDLSAGGVINNTQVEIRSFGQIKFPSTQVSSTDVNTLDDYEEGTWTPGDSSGAGLVFTSVNARYTKIGRVVTLLFELTVPATASSSTFTIGGLPFPSVGRGTVSIGYTTESTAVRGTTFDTQNIFQIYNSAGSLLANSTMSGDTIVGSVHYFAAT
jgi:hypothetical protein